MALTKILNDENKSFQPVLTDKLVYDTKPTVNSFNGITSDAVARAIAGASGEVPAVTESDNGKVLTAVYDEGSPAVEWADAQGGLPSSTSSDNGKVLTVTDTSGTLGWRAIPSSYASFNTTFDLIANGTNVWAAYVQQSSSPAPTIDLPNGVYAYRVEGYFMASASVDDVYNIEVRVGNGNGPQDCKAVGLKSDSDNGVSIRASGILNIENGYGISKAIIYVAVNPAKSSTSSVASRSAGLQLKLARL